MELLILFFYVELKVLEKSGNKIDILLEITL
jgi:hypothetical protein